MSTSSAHGCITQVPGLLAGHWSSSQRPTGCSVVIAPQGAVAAVDVRGAAPGTRETDLLAPGHLVDKVHAVMLGGGSAWGLDAASGVVRWLEQQGIGMDVGFGNPLPLVPAAVLFDLPVGDARIRPDADGGFAACAAAGSNPLACGNVGAGAGATVGKLFGSDHAMKGGIGSASVQLQGVTVGALVACNAVGDVLDPHTGQLLAGARTAADTLTLRDTQRALLQGDAPRFALPGANTTIGIIATDAALSRTELQRLTVAGHDGLARCIRPVHTMLDGDTLFALSTGQTSRQPDLITLSAMAAEAVQLAVLCAVRAAQTLRVGDLWLPAASELQA